MKDLTLFHKTGCPYCHKVLSYLEGRGIEVALKNTAESSDARDELIKIGGKSQVPCLITDGKPLYESDDIIQWFEQNWGKE